MADAMLPAVADVQGTGSNLKGENVPVHVTSIRLNKDNYLSWSAALEIGITSRGRLQYITGEKPAPAKNDPQWATWTLEDSQCEQQKAYRDMLMVGVFLSGLNSVYESAKNQMLTSPSIPPIDEAYSRLSRIPIPAATVPDTTSTMLATRGRGGSFFARGRGGRGRGPPTSRPVCQFCHRIGHTVDKCWQKHGRPVFANQTASTESPEQPKVQHTAPSSELRVDDLLSQLRSLIGDRPQHAPDPTTTTVTTVASASSSSMYSAYTAFPATDTTDWLIDSGMPDLPFKHATSHSQMFNAFNP
ncbi:hypothetical protein EJ110_NYTH58288 [Nymphaea thermarum]|nr:hypothetical protein EJ110_NYTH58288 [Nymphaea thermarum]